MFGISKKHLKFMDQMIKKVERDNGQLERMLITQRRTNAELDESIRQSERLLRSIRKK